MGAISGLNCVTWEFFLNRLVNSMVSHWTNLMSILQACHSAEMLRSVIVAASDEGFFFKSVSFHDKVLAVSQISAEAREEDGIPQCVIATTLPTLGPMTASYY